MKRYTILLILLILILIIYLLYKNLQEYKILENFSSKSIEYKKSFDSDDYLNQNNYTFEGYKKNISNNLHNWNGIWQNIDIPINAQFLQINDKIIIVLGNPNFTQLYNNSQNGNINSDKCINMFIGLGQLNTQQNIFYIKKVLCNMYNNPVLGIGNNNNDDTNTYFSGTINDNIITLIPNISNSTNNIQLNLKESFTNGITYDSLVNYPYLNIYAKEIAPFVSAYPIPYKSYYTSSLFQCPDNTKLCVNQTNGLAKTSYFNIKGNACGIPDSQKNNICNNNVTCLINPPTNPLNNIPACNIQPQINQSINFNSVAMSMNPTDLNNLDICSTLSYFSSNYCNAVILCYISNIGNVQTLNYQFFGSLPNESSLTLQYDTMNNILNNKSTINLQKYRNIISSVNGNSIPTNMQQLNPIIKGLSFTNCLTNSNITKTTDLISNCASTCTKYINNYTSSKSNGNLLPAIWQININKKYNLVNSCGFTLSTFNGYNSPTKFVQCNNDGTINLSLYSGGIDQNLYFDGLNNITEIDPLPNPPFVALTANIRSNNGLYLIPNSSIGGFSNNSHIVSLQNEPEPNSKWLILGFSLNSLNNLTSIINSFSF